MLAPPSTSTSLLSLDLSVFLLAMPAGRPTDRPAATTIQHVVIARAKRMDPAATVQCSAEQCRAGRKGNEGGEERRGTERGANA